MSQTGPSELTPKGTPAAHRRLAALLFLVAAGMVGLSYAAVPLYRMFCQATGFAGTPVRATGAPSAPVPTDQVMTVRFDTNVGAGLNWTFEPVQREVTVRLGENTLVFFRAVNRSDATVVGSATFNVVPEVMGAYFNKIECFCFKSQTLKPGETVEMPVSFFIDPEVLKDKDTRDVHELTLSYTFFKSQDQSQGPADKS